MSKVNVTAQHIASLKPLDVVKDELVRQRFIDLYSALWDEASAESVYERESLHFNRLIADNAKLKACTSVSIFIAFIDLAVSGLSIEQGIRALAYLQPRNYKVGTNAEGKDVYEARCTLTISGYGELIQRERAGQIKHADNPVVVYEGDGFSFTDRNGVKSVNYTLNINHNTSRPIACFMRITRADNSIDYGILLEEGWKRLEGYSEKANSYRDRNGNYVRKVNALYGSGAGGTIDSGFLKAKCIKHAFSTYPKLRVGKGTVYESDVIKPKEEDYYGIEDNQETAASSQAKADTFAEPEDTSAGVTVDPSQSEGNDETF